MQRSFRSLALAMGLAIFLVYLVMASQFESFLHPFVIIFTLPLGRDRRRRSRSRSPARPSTWWR